MRTTNPIESTFASVRRRTVKSRGCGSRASILSTVFKLAQGAEQRWRKLRGAEMLGKVITGVQLKNGVDVPKKDRQEGSSENRRLIKSPYTTFDNIAFVSFIAEVHVPH